MHCQRPWKSKTRGTITAFRFTVSATKTGWLQQYDSGLVEVTRLKTQVVCYHTLTLLIRIRPHAPTSDDSLAQQLLLLTVHRHTHHHEQWPRNGHMSHQLLRLLPLPQQLHATSYYGLDLEKMWVGPRDYDVKEYLGGAGEEGVGKGLLICVKGARRRCGGVRSSGFGFAAGTAAAVAVVAVCWW